jgi:hypothetical protein
MKVKLLKKIRKKYNWYFNKEGFPVLINHYKQTATIYNVELACLKTDTKVEDVQKVIEVPLTTWCLRIMKRDILGIYGYSFDRSIYKIAKRNYKRKLTK